MVLQDKFLFLLKNFFSRFSRRLPVLVLCFWNVLQFNGNCALTACWYTRHLHISPELLTLALNSFLTTGHWWCMRRLTLRTFFYILLDAFLLCVCLLHIPYVVQRPKAPFEVTRKGTLLRVVRVDPSALQSIRTGDLLTRWNGESVMLPEEVEYLADVSPIGSTIRVEVQRDNETITTDVKLVRYYDSPRFLIISLFVGLTVFGVGIFILMSRPTDMAARALHWALVTLATTTMITWGLAVPGAIETYLSRIIWFVSYLGVAVSFFFTMYIPAHNPITGKTNL